MQRHLLWTCSSGSNSLQTAAAGQKSIPDVEQILLKKKKKKDYLDQKKASPIREPFTSSGWIPEFPLLEIAALPHCTRGEPRALVANQKWEMSGDVTATNEVAGTSLTTWLTQQLTPLCIFNSLWKTTYRSLTRFFFFSPPATVSTHSTRLIPCFSFMGLPPPPYTVLAWLTAKCNPWPRSLFLPHLNTGVGQF